MVGWIDTESLLALLLLVLLLLLFLLLLLPVTPRDNDAGDAVTVLLRVAVVVDNESSFAYTWSPKTSNNKWQKLGPQPQPSVFESHEVHTSPHDGQYRCDGHYSQYADIADMTDIMDTMDTMGTDSMAMTDDQIQKGVPEVAIGGR